MASLKIKFLISNLFLAGIIILEIMFKDYVNINFLKYQVMLLFLYSIAFSKVVLKNMLHPYVVFLGTFFVFLISRVFFDLLGLGSFAKTAFFTQYEFSGMIQKDMLFMLLITLAFSNIGVSFSELWHRHIFQIEMTFNKKLYLFSLFLMKVSFLPSIISFFQIFSQVLDFGYIYIYTENFHPPILFRMFTVFQVGYYAFLSSLPAKKTFLKYTVLYFILLSFTMLIGKRGEFAVACLTICIYYHFYIKKISMRKFLIMVLGLILIFQSVLWLRDGIGDINSREYGLESDFIMQFFVQQGGSISVLGYILQFENEFENLGMQNVLYPFNCYINELFNSNIVDLDWKKENVFYCKLSYLANPTMYYAGLGIGSSFVAEAYAIHGFISLILVSFILGYNINFTFIKLKDTSLGLFFLLYFWNNLFFMSRGYLFGNFVDAVKGILFLYISFNFYMRIIKIRFIK